MLLFGWKTDTQAAAIVEELSVGGVILMGRNAAPPNELREKIADLQAKAKAHGLPPLFVAIDQEGGRIQRLTPPDYARHPSAREIGLTGDVEKARSEARAIGEELKAVGVNWNFAPVLDVNNNPKNPVIGDRSYSDDPELVSQMGVAAVRGFQEDAGILACGKHFPGHGDTETDSHHALPRIPHPRSRLEAIELVPFRAAIAAGIGAIMTSHIVFPALDAKLPATLSPSILTGLLREEMGFDGLIITDCLEMKGVAEGWGSAEAAVLAALAGADILLCCHTWKTQVAIQSELAAAVRSGRLPVAQIETAVGRITAAKARWATN